tara:strand:- start:2361 stop:4220 length:1860 start_codon:yes stop_codon:yes gene_type:complete
MPAKAITPIPLSGMGSSGLNTQAQDSTLGPEWLTQADGMVFDLQGRIASRKGIKMVSKAIASPVKSIAGYIKSNRTREYYAGAGNAIYKIDTSTTPYSLTSQSFSGSAQTISDANWTWVNFNDELWGIQTGHKAINYDGTNWYDIDDLGAYAAPAGVTTFDPSCGLGEFGRMWYGGITEAPGVVFYSDNLIGEKLTGGAAGSLDLKTVWGNDEVVGLAAIMDKLVIFGKQNIAIYSGASNPASMALEEVIKGTGLAGKDNIAYVGTDILFLSYEGLMSLGRLQQTDGKAPIQDLSITVRNDLATILSSATVANIKTAYYPEDGLLVIFMPDEKKCYVFDVKVQTQSPRVTTWPLTTAPLCGLGTIDGKLFIGLPTGVAEYTGYIDVTITSDGSGGWTSTDSNYSYVFQTSWLDLNSPTFAKIIKSGLFAITGGRGSSSTISVYKDFELGSPYSKTISLVSGVTISLYTGGDDGAALVAGTRSFYNNTTLVTVTPTANVNGATSSTTALVVDGNSGTIEAGMSVTGTGIVGTVTVSSLSNQNNLVLSSAQSLSNDTALTFKSPAYGSTLAKYGAASGPKDYKVSLGRTGKVIKLKMDTTVEGHYSSLTAATLLTKQGKIR